VGKWQEMLDAALPMPKTRAGRAEYAAAIESDPGRLNEVEQRRSPFRRAKHARPGCAAACDRAARFELLDTDLDLRTIAADGKGSCRPEPRGPRRSRLNEQPVAAFGTMQTGFAGTGRKREVCGAALPHDARRTTHDPPTVCDITFRGAQRRVESRP
jgi:hypothetical protein